MNGLLRTLTLEERRAVHAPRTDIELAVLSDEVLRGFEVPLSTRLIRALEACTQTLEEARDLAREMKEGELYLLLNSRITELDGTREVLMEREAERG